MRAVVGPFCDAANVRVGEFLKTLDENDWCAYLDDFEANPETVRGVIDSRLFSGALTAREES